MTLHDDVIDDSTASPEPEPRDRWALCVRRLQGRMSLFTATVARLALPWTIVAWVMPLIFGSTRSVDPPSPVMMGWPLLMLGALFACLWGSFRAQGRPQTLAIIALFVHSILLLGWLCLFAIMIR